MEEYVGLQSLRCRVAIDRSELVQMLEDALDYAEEELVGDPFFQGNRDEVIFQMGSCHILFQLLEMDPDDYPRFLEIKKRVASGVFVDE